MHALNGNIIADILVYSCALAAIFVAVFRNVRDWDLACSQFISRVTTALIAVAAGTAYGLNVVINPTMSAGILGFCQLIVITYPLCATVLYPLLLLTVPYSFIPVLIFSLLPNTLATTSIVATAYVVYHERDLIKNGFVKTVGLLFFGSLYYFAAFGLLLACAIWIYILFTAIANAAQSLQIAVQPDAAEVLPIRDDDEALDDYIRPPLQRPNPLRHPREFIIWVRDYVAEVCVDVTAVAQLSAFSLRRHFIHHDVVYAVAAPVLVYVRDTFNWCYTLVSPWTVEPVTRAFLWLMRPLRHFTGALRYVYYVVRAVAVAFLNFAHRIATIVRRTVLGIRMPNIVLRPRDYFTWPATAYNCALRIIYIVRNPRARDIGNLGVDVAAWVRRRAVDRAVSDVSGTESDDEYETGSDVSTPHVVHTPDARDSQRACSMAAENGPQGEVTGEDDHPSVSGTHGYCAHIETVDRLLHPHPLTYTTGVFRFVDGHNVYASPTSCSDCVTFTSVAELYFVFESRVDVNVAVTRSHAGLYTYVVRAVTGGVDALAVGLSFESATVLTLRLRPQIDGSHGEYTETDDLAWHTLLGFYYSQHAWWLLTLDADAVSIWTGFVGSYRIAALAAIAVASWLITSSPMPWYVQLITFRLALSEALCYGTDHNNAYVNAVIDALNMNNSLITVQSVVAALSALIMSLAVYHYGGFSFEDVAQSTAVLAAYVTHLAVLARPAIYILVLLTQPVTQAVAYEAPRAAIAVCSCVLAVCAQSVRPSRATWFMATACVCCAALQFLGPHRANEFVTSMQSSVAAALGDVHARFADNIGCVFTVQQLNGTHGEYTCSDDVLDVVIPYYGIAIVLRLYVNRQTLVCVADTAGVQNFGRCRYNDVIDPVTLYFAVSRALGPIVTTHILLHVRSDGVAFINCDGYREYLAIHNNDIMHTLNGNTPHRAVERHKAPVHAHATMRSERATLLGFLAQRLSDYDVCYIINWRHCLDKLPTNCVHVMMPRNLDVRTDVQAIEFQAAIEAAHHMRPGHSVCFVIVDKQRLLTDTEHATMLSVADKIKIVGQYQHNTIVTTYSDDGEFNGGSFLSCDPTDADNVDAYYAVVCIEGNQPVREELSMYERWPHNHVSVNGVDVYYTTTIDFAVDNPDESANVIVTISPSPTPGHEPVRRFVTNGVVVPNCTQVLPDGLYRSIKDARVASGFDSQLQIAIENSILQPIIKKAPFNISQVELVNIFRELYYAGYFRNPRDSGVFAYALHIAIKLWRRFCTMFMRARPFVLTGEVRANRQVFAPVANVLRMFTVKPHLVTSGAEPEAPLAYGAHTISRAAHAPVPFNKLDDTVGVVDLSDPRLDFRYTQFARFKGNPDNTSELVYNGVLEEMADAKTHCRFTTFTGSGIPVVMIPDSASHIARAVTVNSRAVILSGGIVPAAIRLQCDVIRSLMQEVVNTPMVSWSRAAFEFVKHFRPAQVKAALFSHEVQATYTPAFVKYEPLVKAKFEVIPRNIAVVATGTNAARACATYTVKEATIDALAMRGCRWTTGCRREDVYQKYDYVVNPDMQMPIDSKGQGDDALIRVPFNNSTQLWQTVSRVTFLGRDNETTYVSDAADSTFCSTFAYDVLGDGSQYYAVPSLMKTFLRSCVTRSNLPPKLALATRYNDVREYCHIFTCLPPFLKYFTVLLEALSPYDITKQHITERERQLLQKDIDRQMHKPTVDFSTPGPAFREGFWVEWFPRNLGVTYYQFAAAIDEVTAQLSGLKFSTKSKVTYDADGRTHVQPVIVTNRPVTTLNSTFAIMWKYENGELLSEAKRSTFMAMMHSYISHYGGRLTRMTPSSYVEVQGDVVEAYETLHDGHAKNHDVCRLAIEAYKPHVLIYAGAAPGTFANKLNVDQIHLVDIQPCIDHHSDKIIIHVEPFAGKHVAIARDHIAAGHRVLVVSDIYAPDTNNHAIHVLLAECSRLGAYVVTKHYNGKPEPNLVPHYVEQVIYPNCAPGECYLTDRRVFAYIPRYAAPTSNEMYIYYPPTSFKYFLDSEAAITAFKPVLLKALRQLCVRPEAADDVVKSLAVGDVRGIAATLTRYALDSIALGDARGDTHMHRSPTVLTKNARHLQYHYNVMATPPPYREGAAFLIVPFRATSAGTYRDGVYPVSQAALTHTCKQLWFFQCAQLGSKRGVIQPYNDDHTLNVNLRCCDTVTLPVTLYAVNDYGRFDSSSTVPPHNAVMTAIAGVTYAADAHDVDPDELDDDRRALYDIIVDESPDKVAEQAEHLNNVRLVMKGCTPALRRGPMPSGDPGTSLINTVVQFTMYGACAKLFPEADAKRVRYTPLRKFNKEVPFGRRHLAFAAGAPPAAMRPIGYEPAGDPRPDDSSSSDSSSDDSDPGDAALEPVHYRRGTFEPAQPDRNIARNHRFRFKGPAADYTAFRNAKPWMYCKDLDDVPCETNISVDKDQTVVIRFGTRDDNAAASLKVARDALDVIVRSCAAGDVAVAEARDQKRAAHRIQKRARASQRVARNRPRKNAAPKRK